MMDQSEVERRLIQLRIDLDNMKAQQDALIRKALSTASAVSKIPATTTTAVPIITPPSAPNIKFITFGFDVYAVGTITWYIPIRQGAEGSFLDVIATAVHAPTSTVVFDIQKSTNNGVSWSSILSGTLQLTAGQLVGSSVNSFAIKSCNIGDLLRATILSGGTDASEVALILRYA